MAPANAIFILATAGAVSARHNRRPITCAPLPSALFLWKKERREEECAGCKIGS